MTAMTTHERLSLTYNHKEADRVPIVDWLWPSTQERWQREGLPEGCDFHSAIPGPHDKRSG